VLLPQDVSLFEGIISDLFPGVLLPQPDYGVFLDALKTCIAKRRLQPVPWFIEKIIQVLTNNAGLDFVDVFFCVSSFFIS